MPLAWLEIMGQERSVFLGQEENIPVQACGWSEEHTGWCGEISFLGGKAP